MACFRMKSLIPAPSAMPLRNTARAFTDPQKRKSRRMRSVFTSAEKAVLSRRRLSRRPLGTVRPSGVSGTGDRFRP